MTTKALGTSIGQKLRGIQKKAGVPYQMLATAFLIERLVVRLIADERLKKALVFKGGFVSLRVYGIGDPVTPGPVATKTPTLLSGEELSWFVYPVETMIAEKLHALVARGDANSRSKDIYDLNLFLPKANPKTLMDALNRCFTYRKTELPENLSDVLSKLNTTILEKGWANAITSVPNAPDFKAVFDELTAQVIEIEKSLL
jgi:hypothetical protein